ncbi:5285_t:CDS:2 [Funneliformis geosporum]|nr:5285_t:CDS:2 [Funneliformis geosporum]
MDGVENEEKFADNLKSIREKLGVEPLPVQFPIGAGRELKGIVDIIEQKAYYYSQLGNKEKAKEEEYQIKGIPSQLVARTKKYRHELVEKIGKVIEQNEELLLKHLEGQELSAEEIKKLLRQATLTGEYFPVFCGSAYKHVGVKLLLDGVINYLPSPLDVGEIPTFSLLDRTKVGSVNCNSPLPYLALVFKIVFDDRNQRVTFIRVYAGKISAGSQIYNVNQGKEERVRSLVRMHADNKEKIGEVGAGDIAAIIGLEYAITGDTFGDKKNSLLLETIDFAEPVISQAIEPRTNKDKDKLRDALENLKIQDPSFKYRMDRETGQMIIAGMGELHLEVSVERLRKEYKLDLEITLEPNEKGKGFEFIDAKKGQDMSNKDAEEVKEGLQEVVSSGLLLNYPLLDVKATLLGGKRHEVDTQPGDFKSAAVLAFRGDGVAEKEKRIQELGVILLEPVMQIEVVVPKDYMGDILADLGSRRTVIENTEEKEGSAYISGKTPLKEILSYSTTLRQLTKGRGEYSMHLSRYQEVPKKKYQSRLKEHAEAGGYYKPNLLENEEQRVKMIQFMSNEDYSLIDTTAHFYEEVKKLVGEEKGSHKKKKEIPLVNEYPFLIEDLCGRQNDRRVKDLEQQKQVLQIKNQELEQQLANQSLSEAEKQLKKQELAVNRKLLAEKEQELAKLRKQKPTNPTNTETGNNKLN